MDAPAEPAKQGQASSDDPPARKPSRVRRVVFAVALAVATVVGVAYYLHTRHFEDTDDAQIDGDISAISARVAGNVKAVYVIENQHVEAGALLAEIDDADYQVALQQAKAAVLQAEAQLKAEEPGVAITETTNTTLLATSGSDVANAQADLTAAEHAVEQADAVVEQVTANAKLANIQLERAKQLLSSQTIPQAEYDQRAAEAASANAALAAAQQAKSAAHDRVMQARARLKTASSRASEVKENSPREVETKRASVEVRRAILEVAKAQLAQAELNLTYTKIVAPVSGTIGKKTVSVGDRVQPGQQLLAITPTEKLWVTANFRETQLKDMQPGQRAEIYVDAIDKDLTGTVESIGGATGSRYSLLPPENAVGNYVKVVQRVPVRIQLDANQPGLDRLRPGLSVEPKVRVR